MRDLLVTVTCDRLITLQITGLMERSPIGYKGERLSEVTVAPAHRNRMHNSRFIYGVNVSERSSFVCHRVHLTGEDGD